MPEAQSTHNTPDVSEAVSHDTLSATSYRIDPTPAIAAGANVDQFLGPWAIEPVRGVMMLQQFSGRGLAEHVAANADYQSPLRRRVLKEHGEIDAYDLIPRVQTVDGKTIALPELSGALTKRGSSLGGGRDSTVLMRDHMMRLSLDPLVDAIVLRLDTPGGSVAGTADLANSIGRADQRKPVLIYGEDLVASAGMWIASQGRRFYMNDASGYVGSVGAFIGLYDISALAKREGVEAVVIRARPGREDNMKGMGFPGTAITPEHRAYLQSLMERTQDFFSQAVATGRGVDVAQIEALANGKVWHPDDPTAAILHDGIASLEDVIEEAAALSASDTPAAAMPGKAGDSRPQTNANADAVSAMYDQLQITLKDWPRSVPLKALAIDPAADHQAQILLTTSPSPGDTAVPDSNTTTTTTMTPATTTTAAPAAAQAQAAAPQPATLAELEAAMPRASADFKLAQLKAGATLSAAMTAYTQMLETELAAKDAAAGEAAEQAKQAAAAKPAPGNKPVGAGVTDTAGAGDDFESAVAAYRKDHPNVSQHEASRAVLRANPEMRLRMVHETNQQMGRHKQAAELEHELAAV